MAATTSFTAKFPVAYGRSGYNNKPDEDDETKDQGRSGYNKYEPVFPLPLPTKTHDADGAASSRGDKGDDEEEENKSRLSAHN